MEQAISDGAFLLILTSSSMHDRGRCSVRGGRHCDRSGGRGAHVGRDRGRLLS